MDQNLKQRLVGVVVITSLAAIFVPMLFDDPIDDNGKTISELLIPKTPVISDIKTNQPKTIQDVVNLPIADPIKEEIFKRRPGMGLASWFLQVGIFGQEENAIALQDKIRKQGFPVTILKVSGSDGVLYKVRVGPELDIKRVEAMKAKIDELNNLNSIIISKQ